MRTGKLLARNEGPGTVPLPSTVNSNGHIDNSIYDPLSENFVIPPSIPHTPRGLAIFFTQQLRKRSGAMGERWTSVFHYAVYLRPAQILLEEVGFENAVRTIVHATRVANHVPTFKFVLKCAERFQQCPEIGSLI